jgi:GNAT superfamily N-acetyltransferase
MEAALEIRTAITPNEIAGAVTIDEAHVGSKHRADYIRSVAESGGLSVAVLRNEVQAFCCLDHNCFFEKPFISLLIVSPHARRQGLGAGLLSHNSSTFPEIWTSTNRSNSMMRKLLEKAGWRYCGEISGLDDGDPEQFFKTA